MDARHIILKKRDGGELSGEELAYVVNGFTSGEVPDYQMSAWLMAVLLRGMSDNETHEMTDLMVRSGRALLPEDFPGPSADKHSTGGVGDKVSLALAPLVACAGVYVPMLSGRGLGHTGGTLDKIESVAGLRTDLGVEEFISQVASVGCCIASQSAEMNPADGKIYALRDVTGTVESTPLIISSIVSKKVAEGAGSLVFDVKWGRGAFVKEVDDALELAFRLVREAERFGRSALAFVTDMNQPLGRAIGNALEMIEAIDVLRGSGPEDVTSVTLTLGGAMLYLAGAAEGVEEGADSLRKSIRSGAALEKLKELARAQGGDPRVIEETSLLGVSDGVGLSAGAEMRTIDVASGRDGYVGSIDARALGELVCDLGGGRKTKTDVIDRKVGALLLKKEGDQVKRGETLIELHAAAGSAPKDLSQKAARAFEVSPERPQPRPLIPWIVTAEGPARWRGRP